MKKIVLFLILTVGFLSISPAGAVEVPDHDGYLLQVRTEGASLFSSIPDGIDAVVPEIGIYRVDTLEDAAFFPSEDIVCMEPNYYVELFDAEETSEAWNLGLMGVDAARRIDIDGSGVRIGIVDSGLYAEHDAFADARIIKGFNYIEQNADTSDGAGHGTFVTGILTSVAPGSEVVPLKCFDGKTGTMAHIVAAIYGGVDDYSCDILNLSFGLSTNSETLREAVQYAAAQGVIMVAAVGNDGTREVKYPAGYDEVIGVGMVGADKKIASKSQRNGSVLFTAPGEGVTGPGIDGVSAYRTSSGTSYACPHVAAVTALLLQAVPDTTAGNVCAALISGAEDLGNSGYDESYGYGFLSVTGLLSALPPLTERSDAGILLRAVRRLPEEVPSQVWVASYNDMGRMLDCVSLSADVKGGALAVNGVVPLPEDTEMVKLFFLRDGDLGPALEMERVKVA